jgi:hypothetical protein
MNNRVDISPITDILNSVVHTLGTTNPPAPVIPRLWTNLW